MKWTLRLIIIALFLLLTTVFAEAYRYGYGMMGSGSQMMGYYSSSPYYAGYPAYNYYNFYSNNLGYSSSFARTNYYSRFNGYRTYNRNFGRYSSNIIGLNY